jgi:hypothetical protein
MSKEAYEKIKAGLEDAVAFAKETRDVQENLNGQRASEGVGKESTGDNARGTNPAAEVHDNNLPGESGQAEVRDPGEEVTADLVEYSLGIFYEHGKCGRIAMTDPKLVHGALQNAGFAGLCPVCNKPVKMTPRQRMIVVPAGQMPRNRHDRRAMGLVGPNGKRVL